MEQFLVLHEKPIILVVDDTPDNLSLMTDLLKDDYRVKVATNGERALKLVQAQPPSLILLDIMMPGMDGYEVCRRLKRDPATEDIPVMFLTAKAEIEDETLGLALGAVDYIIKPISPPIMLARIKMQLMFKSASDFLRGKGDFLEVQVAKRTAEIQDLQDAMVLTMASLAETRDNETGNHIKRTQHFVKRLAQQLRGHPKHSDWLTDRHIDLLFKSAPLHDIGKVGIPDKILLKPGKLDRDEFDIMETHASMGHDAIVRAEQELGREVPFLRIAKAISLSHHEKWDGSGYPQGLSGEDIPLPARLMALADVYDALTTRRVYKPAFTHEVACRILNEGRGSHFDPDVVDAFVAVQDDFRMIASRFAEPEDA